MGNEQERITRVGMRIFMYDKYHLFVEYVWSVVSA